MPPELLKIFINWLADRKVRIMFGNVKFEFFKIHVGLPQGSSLSPFLFIIFHANITKCVDAFPTHLFADDISTLIVPPCIKVFKK